MRLLILAFGKVRTPGLRETLDYYIRNLSAWMDVEELELKPIPVPDKSPNTRQLIQEKEAELLLSKVKDKLSPRGKLYLLDERGKTQDTQSWAGWLKKLENESTPELALCIGSSLGFHEIVRKRASGSLSFGPQTYPHELARVVLLEQLYRACSVNRGHPYHNEGA